ncbi:hypothetical protein HYPBUDRAFT_183227 [Hyphopichia burtonii NRRL Y-1933]|uniref:Uncharacterized protein n=1 Tax=Hyphopichia burtonii NRRL Y-1933 TaxID=984485 RepID=A0A1E4RBL0_9ASCO|nr:hypothetical protein HYPBUDRAFT_183227 [Hyphopichia burtonii NRRL Y-1933]ODV64639.1 hypothetical protein HYPBUDRAFT_183227 [Hyphopichia burtonii NRRL Y-1933]
MNFERLEKNKNKKSNRKKDGRKKKSQPFRSVRVSADGLLTWGKHPCTRVYSGRSLKVVSIRMLFTNWYAI